MIIQAENGVLTTGLITDSTLSNGQGVGNIANSSEGFTLVFAGLSAGNYKVRLGHRVVYTTNMSGFADIIIDGITVANQVTLPHNGNVNALFETGYIAIGANPSVRIQGNLTGKTFNVDASPWWGDYVELAPQPISATPVLNSIINAAASSSITGTATAASIVKVYKNGTFLTQFTANGSGVFTGTISVTGGDVITATAEDPDGSGGFLAASTVSSAVTVRYGNAAASQAFTRNNCGSGLTGSTYTYPVLVNTFFATTQAAANTLAANDITANGQIAANNNGTCTPNATFASPTPAPTAVANEAAATGTAAYVISGCTNLPSGSTFSLVPSSAINCSTPVINATTGAYSVTGTGGSSAYTMSFNIQVKNASGTNIGVIPISVPVSAAVVYSSSSYYVPIVAATELPPTTVTGLKTSTFLSTANWLWLLWALLIASVGYLLYRLWPLLFLAKKHKTEHVHKPASKPVPRPVLINTFAK
jgi:hypothetical protein